VGWNVSFAHPPSSIVVKVIHNTPIALSKGMPMAPEKEPEKHKR
jgi:hypothetical protein